MGKLCLFWIEGQGRHSFMNGDVRVWVHLRRRWICMDLCLPECVCPLFRGISVCRFMTLILDIRGRTYNVFTWQKGLNIKISI